MTKAVVLGKVSRFVLSCLRSLCATLAVRQGCSERDFRSLRVLVARKLGLARCILEGGRIGKVCVRGPGLRSCGRSWSARAGFLLTSRKGAGCLCERSSFGFWDFGCSHAVVGLWLTAYRSVGAVQMVWELFADAVVGLPISCGWSRVYSSASSCDVPFRNPCPDGCLEKTSGIEMTWAVGFRDELKLLPTLGNLQSRTLHSGRLVGGLKDFGRGEVLMLKVPVVVNLTVQQIGKSGDWWQMLASMHSLIKAKPAGLFGKHGVLGAL
ncbi:unnamed protein product [Prunus armeniaca]